MLVGVAILLCLEGVRLCEDSKNCPNARRRLTLEPLQRLLADDAFMRSSQKCRFEFTEVREDKRQCAYGCCKCVQLSEVIVYDAEHTALNVTSIANPAGRSPPGQGPGSAADGNAKTKWIDFALADGYPPGPRGMSVLEIEFDSASSGLSVAEYELFTGNDAVWRDPVAWSVRCWTNAATPRDGVPQWLELVDHRGEEWGLPVAAPTERMSSYGRRPLGAPSPPSPPDRPTPPPSTPPPPVREGDLRLMGGDSLAEGRLEVMHAGRWGTVCDDQFSVVDARVACRQLGWPAAGAAIIDRVVRGSHARTDAARARGRVWMDGLACLGNEDRLDACPFGGWGIEDCSHAEDALLKCDARPAVPPAPPAPLPPPVPPAPPPRPPHSPPPPRPWPPAPYSAECTCAPYFRSVFWLLMAASAMLAGHALRDWHRDRGWHRGRDWYRQPGTLDGSDSGKDASGTPRPTMTVRALSRHAEEDVVELLPSDAMRSHSLRRSLW